MLRAAPTTPVFKSHHRARLNGGWRYVIAMLCVALISTTARAEIYYVHNDHRGAPLAMTDANKTVVWRADYAPFGKANITVQTKVLNLRLPGQYFDAETGLHYNYFRDYDPNAGRYLQPDPIGLQGGLNPYAYGKNNPLRFTDKLGLQPDSCVDPLGNKIECPRDICATPECAGGLLPNPPPSRVSPCELKCSLIVGSVCKPVAAKTPGPFFAKAASYGACEIVIEYACRKGCEKKDHNCGPDAP